MPLSVNVSPTQFRQADFVAQVQQALQDSGAPARLLVLEVTEGLLIDKMDDTIARMHQLTALGLRFSIDDFGTGYSSMAYLKKMPLYELKIDRSFIIDTPHDASSTALVQSILAMAGHLGLRVVAEGVETQAQADFLVAHDCACMQGYLYARPQPLEALIARLRA
jgi:EAL domain-containing protein (putative c-di-GMP-specific phosphodiesterase class I)